MQDHTPSLLSFIGQALGVPLGAIPLSFCKIQRPYLLDRQGLTSEGTAVMLAVPYVMTGDVYDPQRNLSLYAVPRDYHAYFEKLAEELIPILQNAYPHGKFALFADHSPILEVEAAALCGLGVIGDNGLIITPDYGSFVFLAEVITDLSYGEVTGSKHFASPDILPRCEGCGACVRACHGHCLPDGRDTCISAISQKKGDLSEKDISFLSAQPLVWGCDTCQTVCPHNKAVIKAGRDTPVVYFREERILCLDRERLNRMTEDEFKTRAYAWRGRVVIERNIRIWEERRPL